MQDKPDIRHGDNRRIGWRELGQIQSKKAASHVPTKAGLYKLTFMLFGRIYVYIGQAGNVLEQVHMTHDRNGIPEIIADGR